MQNTSTSFQSFKWYQRKLARILNIFQFAGTMTRMDKIGKQVDFSFYSHILYILSAFSMMYRSWATNDWHCYTWKPSSQWGPELKEVWAGNRVTESCRGNVWLVSSESIWLNGTVDFGSFVVGSLSKVLPFWGTSAFMFSAVFSGLG